MRSADEDLFWRGDVKSARARILVAQFDGAFGAGGAARLTVGEMLRSLPMERVAAFGTNAFLDYGSHQPFTTVSNWVLGSVEVPELVLDRVGDDLGDPVLVLHSAEPDVKWESFSRIVTGLATRTSVEIVVSFNGIPSGAPHTGPTPVRVQATKKAPTPRQPQMAATLRSPTPMTTFLQERLASQGIPGIVSLTTVPFYVADTAYPAGASAPLSALSGLADLSLLVGELEQDIAEEHTAIERTLESNFEIQHTVAALEKHFDALNGAGKGGVPPGEWTRRTPLRSERKVGKDIGDVIETYLANLAEWPEKDEAEGAQAKKESDPLQAALRRVELHRLNPNAPRNVGRSRYSAQPGPDESAASSSAGPSAQGESISGEQNSGEESSHWFLRGDSTSSAPS